MDPWGLLTWHCRGDLTGRGLAEGHTKQPVVLGTPKVGPNSMLVRVGPQPKGGVLAKGDGPLRSSKSQSLILLAKGQDCGPKGSNLSPFKGFEVDCRLRPKQGLAVEFEKPAVGVFVSGPRAACLGLSVEEIKAKLSPSSSSYRESGETEDEEVEEGDDIENISTTMSPHSDTKPECKEIEKIEGDSLSKRYKPLVSHFYTFLSSSFSERDPSMEGLFGQGCFLRVVVIAATRWIP